MKKNIAGVLLKYQDEGKDKDVFFRFMFVMVGSLSMFLSYTVKPMQFRGGARKR